MTPETPSFIPTNDAPNVDAETLAEIAALEATPPGVTRAQKAKIAVDAAVIAATPPGLTVAPAPIVPLPTGGDPADAIRAMQAELAAVRAELDVVKNTKKAGDLLDENASVGGYPWRYYRLPPNWPDPQGRNWIVIAPGGQGPKGEMDAKRYAGYLHKGMRSVDGYGFPDVPTTTKGADSYKWILERGGAKEFPCSQVIAYRWHTNPPIKGLKFPQYEANKANVLRLTCASCGQVSYFMRDDRTAGDTYRRHLVQTHKYPFEHAALAVEKAGFKIEAFTEGVQELDEDTKGIVPTAFTEESLR